MWRLLVAIRLVILDCDRTLWEHEDVFTLQPPFTRVDGQTVQDAQGEKVRLAPGARELLDALRRRGILISLCSWNRADLVFAILDLLGLTQYFVHPKVEFHPHKDRMITALLAELAGEGTVLQPEEVLFVDDNPMMLEQVRQGVGPVRTLRAQPDVLDLRNVLKVLDEQN
ncbi:MAG: magnesium-dependent phosphatase-1 [Bacillati bacterium ANGP1]|uniref:Magnesium-dependent phosphatase-1 n=1 Tax=Candidatus Segetimicrobium genomatis TaxID=2569760 RepID=A0A537M007_9BACT|nr:MAG: magnesium-dependent phosphatase-1 [Terrabacteria group bacterium ANGP1]TMJ13177.1 MAG: magnesium-dependent phosphatase-1 [Terrabacteria group bacterium ANGP1]